MAKKTLPAVDRLLPSMQFGDGNFGNFANVKLLLSEIVFVSQILCAMMFCTV